MSSDWSSTTVWYCCWLARKGLRGPLALLHQRGQKQEGNGDQDEEELEVNDVVTRRLA
jgi:hypothetical protein